VTDIVSESDGTDRGSVGDAPRGDACLPPLPTPGMCVCVCVCVCVCMCMCVCVCVCVCVCC
jgi:hypothetical protein